MEEPVNSIERFQATIDRHPADRPACWLGIPKMEAVTPLCAYYGVETFQELKTVIGDDIYSVEVPYSAPGCSAIYAAFDWYRNGRAVDCEHRTLTAKGCFAECESIEDALALNFPWPDPEGYISPDACAEMLDQIPKDKAILGMVWACHFQDFCAAFGMENALVNMIEAPELVHYVNDKIIAFYLKALRFFLDATKGRIHAVLIGNDLGSQLDLMISPESIREFVIPGAKQLIDLAHSYGVKVIYHSCGAIRRVIPMLIEAGADAIHPIQAMASGMEPFGLKQDFGTSVSFCGGVDTQYLLPNGSSNEVKAAVRNLREIFPTGLIISPSHEAIQVDVSLANIKAMFDEAQEIYNK